MCMCMCCSFPNMIYRSHISHIHDLASLLLLILRDRKKKHHSITIIIPIGCGIWNLIRKCNILISTPAISFIGFCFSLSRICQIYKHIYMCANSHNKEHLLQVVCVDLSVMKVMLNMEVGDEGKKYMNLWENCIQYLWHSNNQFFWI